MRSDDVLDLFKNTGALLEGHFLYTSGRHGRRFLQAARVMQYPKHTEQLCAALAARFSTENIELVIGPATGGIVLAYETARCLGARAAYTEKDGQNGMALKRGFRLAPGTRVIVVEDIITTGGSVQKSIDHLLERGANVIGVGALIDRSGGTAQFACRFESLAALSLESWSPDQCPLCKEGAPLIEPDEIVIFK